LIQQRLQAGTASALDTSQQESLVNTQRATIPPLEQTLRPDIRQAEANLAAANANVANARAQFLPSIQLAGEGGYQNALLKTLLRSESAFYTAVASLMQPIFHGGQLLGNLDLTKGQQDELLQNYCKAVISAFSDVENALDDIRKTAERESLQREVVTTSQRAFDISEQRLREGTVDLVTVQTQQTLYVALDALVQARLAHVLAIVSLYQALGGVGCRNSWCPPMHGELRSRCRRRLPVSLLFGDGAGRVCSMSRKERTSSNSFLIHCRSLGARHANQRPPRPRLLLSWCGS